jgi:hypothetical protein
LTASRIVTTPSRTLKLRVTSPEKSTWPGVSIRLIWCPNQLKLIAADLIVIPLSLYCAKKSIAVVPSSISKFTNKLYFLVMVVHQHNKAFFM